MFEPATVLIVDPRGIGPDRYEAMLDPEAAGLGDDRRAGLPVRLVRATSGEEAVIAADHEAAEGRVVACGFFRIRLPGRLDGISTARRVRELHGAVACAFLAASDDRGAGYSSAILGADEGADWDLLVEPVSPPELVQRCRRMVQGWLRRRRANASLEAGRRRLRALRVRRAMLEHELEAGPRLPRELSDLQIACARMESDTADGFAPASKARALLDAVDQVLQRLGSAAEQLALLRDWLAAADPSLASSGSGRGRALSGARPLAGEDLRAARGLVARSLRVLRRVGWAAGHLRVTVAPVSLPGIDIADVLRSAAATVALGASHRPELVLDLQAAAGCEHDLGDLRPAWVELLRNAVEATASADRPGRVTVSCAASGQELVLRVDDDGGGMSDSVLARAFEPGFSAWGGAPRAGVGLTVARALVRDAGGRIDIDSEPGHGTRVLVRLPLLAGSAEEAS